jgi:hypothetical protein
MLANTSGVLVHHQHVARLETDQTQKRHLAVK